MGAAGGPGQAEGQRRPHGAESAPDGAENASVQDLAVFPGCAAAAALGEGEAPGRVQIWTLEALLDTLAENL